VTQHVQLKGITWGHTRGVLPMVATGQRYAELHPDVRVQWDIRSLQAFADQSIDVLAKQYDLLVIDHPSIGEAQAHGLFAPLDQHLSGDFLADQARHSVGASHASYHLEGHQWALAIDAATPVSAARLDVLQRHGFQVPQTWDELLELARADLVAFAGLKLDCLMNFYTLCLAEGDEPFCSAERMVDPDAGASALRALKELTDACGPACLSHNPIAVYELMTSGDAYGYSPFAYGYSNYARASYVDKPLAFGGLVQRNGKRLTSTLGGAGLAVSAHSAHLEHALRYAEFVASGAVQRGLYTENGGQPAHRSAWLDESNNRLTNHFFSNTLQTLDEAYVRPRYCGTIHFQEQAPDVLARYLRGEEDIRRTLQDLNLLDSRFRQGRSNARSAMHRVDACAR
jgi:multiple sugar transport system substrate-binding protein